MLTTLRTDNRDVSFTIRVDYQRLLLDHLDVIDHIVQTTGRRRHLSASEQEDFAGAVRLKFIEDDYAVLRKFQHRSSLRTYLASVIERQSLDFCVQQWGRWRPSAVADRLGPVAVLLERLVTRDGHSLEEAMEMAHTNHAVLESERQLRDLWAQLPVRTRTTQVGEEAAAGVSSDQTSESNIADAEHQANITRLDRALLAAFTALPSRPGASGIAIRPGPVHCTNCRPDRRVSGDAPPPRRTLNRRAETHPVHFGLRS